MEYGASMDDVALAACSKHFSHLNVTDGIREKYLDLNAVMSTVQSMYA